MVQVINDPNRRNVADSFSSGLSNLIQGLAHNKAQQLHQAKERADLQNAFPELPHGALNFLAQQPPKERLQYLQSFAQGLPQEQEVSPHQPQQANLENLLQQSLQQAQQPAIPYAPEYKGPKQAEFGGKEQLAALQQAQQIKQQLSKPVVPAAKKPMTLTQSLATPSPKAAALDEKKQMQIEKINKPFVDKMTEYVSSAKKRKQLAQQALDLVKGDKVTGGLVGLFPESILTSLSADNAKFVTLVGELANEKALELRGPVGKAKIEAAQRTKAALNQPKAAQEEILKREIKAAAKAEALEAAYEQVISENNGTEPANLESKVRSRAKQLEKQFLQEDRSEADFPNPSEYESGSVIEVDNIQYRKDKSGQWIQV